MTKVSVSKNVLLWATERSGLPREALQHKFPRIEEWVAGKSQPTLKQLDSLAKSTFTPLGYFFLPEPPQEQMPIPYYRTIASPGQNKPSPNLLETIQIMQRRQTWMRDFLVDQGQEKLDFVSSVKLDEPAFSVAEKIRYGLGLDKAWAEKESSWSAALKTLRETMEASGILVVANGIVENNTNRKLDVDEFRGFVLVDDYAPFVFINGADGKAAQMFTLAHELAHVFIGSSAAFDLREMQPSRAPTEVRCNSIAAEFLVPERELRKIWPSIADDSEPFQVIARKFKISSLVAARRALDISLISRVQFREFYLTYLDSERQRTLRRAEGGDFYANQNLRVGRRFASAVAQAALEGKLLYSEAFSLTGLYGKTFDQYTLALTGGGA